MKPALAYCDTKTDTATTQYLSVANADEVAEAVASHKGKTALAFVDTTCAVAYTNAGFLSVAAKDSEHALAYLIRAETLGPFWAGSFVEHAYWLRELGDLQNSLLIYRKALALTEKYRASAGQRAIALRGIGFNLTELGDLDGAQPATTRPLPHGKAKTRMPLPAAKPWSGNTPDWTAWISTAPWAPNATRRPNN